MRGGGPPAVDVVGRRAEIDQVRDGLDAGEIVIIDGPVGIGKTSLAGAATADRPTRWITCLFGLAVRPAGVLRGQLGNVPGDDPPERIADWVVEQVGQRTLVVDDVQFADACSLRVFELVAARAATLFVVRCGEPRSEHVLGRLRRLAGGRVVALGGLELDDCVELAVRSGASPADAAIAARAGRGHPLWVKHAIGAEEATSVTRTLAAVVDRLDTPERTVLAALGLLGRPAHRTLLGPGVQRALVGGFVRDDDGLVSLVHPMYGEVAVARTTSVDRAELHRELGGLVEDPGEASRHLVAGGDLDGAAAAARRAAAAATAPLERASHLDLVARCTSAAQDLVAAAGACVDAGDPASAIAWIEQVDPRSAHFAAGAAIAARAARALGDGSAATWAKRGLAAPDGQDGSTWRQLVIEEHMARSHGSLDGDELLERCAGSAEEPLARLAVALRSVAGRQPGWQRPLREAIDCAARAGDAACELDGRWLLTAAHAATGDLGAAATTARVASDRAAELGAPHWVQRFDAERAWIRAVLDPRSTSAGRDEAILALGLGDAGQYEAARALLGHVTDPGTRHLAVSSTVEWWDHEDARAGRHAAAALGGPADPIVVLLAGPTAVWAQTQTSTPSTTVELPRALALEADAVRRRVDDPATAVDRFTDAVSAWSDVSPRSAVRCAWAAADIAVQADDERAPGLVRDAVAAVDEHGVHALDGRVRRLALAAGLRGGRTPRSDGGPLTVREREVLTHVAAGLTNRQIGVRLGISAATVNAHVRSSIAKLGASNRRHAAAHVVGAEGVRP